MTKSEIAYVRQIAKHELSTTDSYIDNENKWLYNVKNGNTYFALYSTEDVNEPTILYACKGNQAKNEYTWFMRFIDELRSVDNGNYEQSTSVLNQMLEAFWDGYGSNNRHTGDSLGRRSNGRDVRTTNQRTDFRPSEALLNCLRNIREIQERNERNGVVKYSEAFKENSKMFSLRDNVEETKELIAVHNLTESKLLKSIQLGGLPMPSIAKLTDGSKIGYAKKRIMPNTELWAKIKKESSRSESPFKKPSTDRISQKDKSVNTQYMQKDKKYSDRDLSLNSRTLLSNALESTAQNDIEKKYISQYKEKIETIDAEQTRIKKGIESRRKTELKAKIKKIC